MGIRFHCPNGHRIHAKAFLAGKRGHCPQCGAMVEIPFESEADNAARGSGAGSEATDESTDTMVLDVPILTKPHVLPTGEWSMPPETQSDPASHAAVPTNSLAAPSAGESSVAVWYVRLATGEQYGPVRDEVVRRWIEHGQVIANTPLWREGWEDWKPTAKVFQVLSVALPNPGKTASTDVEVKPAKVPVSEFPDVVPVNRVLPSVELSPAADVPEKRPWTPKELKTLVSIGLLLLVGVLGTVILFMLFGLSKQSETEPQPNAAKETSAIHWASANLEKC